MSLCLMKSLARSLFSASLHSQFINCSSQALEQILWLVGPWWSMVLTAGSHFWAHRNAEVEKEAPGTGLDPRSHLYNAACRESIHQSGFAHLESTSNPSQRGNPWRDPPKKRSPLLCQIDPAFCRMCKMHMDTFTWVQRLHSDGF